MEFTFKAELWEYDGKGAWHFITVPKDISDDIREIHTGPKRGFGSKRAEVTVGKSTWKTSVFPGGDDDTYVLPVKKSVRASEGLADGESAEYTITLIEA